jgi:hypothetical protein
VLGVTPEVRSFAANLYLRDTPVFLVLQMLSESPFSSSTGHEFALSTASRR